MKMFPVAFGLAAVVSWTSWGVIGQAAAMRGSPARHALSAREKFELGERLRAAATDPHQISKSDVAAARKAHGADASKLFETLRRASR